MLNENDRVVIAKSSKYYGTTTSVNPRCVGTIKRFGEGWAHVLWDNGTYNEYKPEELELNITKEKQNVR